MIAGRAGISPSEWEAMTPACFRAYIRGYLEEQRFQTETRQKQDYNLAVMVRAAIGEKRMPEYERFFKKQGRQNAAKNLNMTDRQMYQQVLALNAALGGTVNGE